jgi:hypothetical protein
MSDERSYLQKTQDLARQRMGRELSDSEIAGNFSIHGNERRSQILDQIESEERAADAIGSDTQSLKDAGRRLRTIQAVRDAHARLRRLGR